VTKNSRPGQSSGEIYHALRQQILSNQLSANQQLRQDDIASQFGVSKIPVREALRQLAADGLVEFKPRRGAFVTELTEDDILENLEIRQALETHALAMAIPNMTHNDFQQANAILQEYQHATDMQQWSELNRRFHLCLYAPCGLPKLIGMLQEIKARNQSFITLQITHFSGFERAHEEHVEILQACKNNDTERGVALLKQHIEHTKKEVMAHFRTSQNQR